MLGVDPGERRVGLALSDPFGWTAQPLATLERRDGDGDAGVVAQVRALVEEHEVARVVVGQPRRMDGTDGPAAEAARRFAADVQRACGRPVELWDERFTTAQAGRVLAAAGVRRGKRRAVVDQVAAVLILQSWLDAHGGDGA